MGNSKDYVSLWRNPAIGAVIGGVAGSALGYFARENYVPAIQTVVPLITGSLFGLAGSVFAMAHDLREKKDQGER